MCVFFDIDCIQIYIFSSLALAVFPDVFKYKGKILLQIANSESCGTKRNYQCCFLLQ